jgi:hypothetical protein
MLHSQAVHLTPEFIAEFVLDYPGLLDLPRAQIRAYRPETSIAEKTEAMMRLAYCVMDAEERGDYGVSSRRLRRPVTLTLSHVGRPRP